MEINNCNCRNKSSRLLRKMFQTKNMTYKASIGCKIAGYKQKFYRDPCETSLKVRFRNHENYPNTAHVKIIRKY